jgi:hypothetical protein
MMVATLITIMRCAAPTDREELILDRAVRVLDERHHGVPVLRDLIEVIEDAPEEVRHVAMDRGDMTRYQDFTDGLLVSHTGGAGLVGVGGAEVHGRWPVGVGVDLAMQLLGLGHQRGVRLAQAQAVDRAQRGELRYERRARGAE